MNMIIFEFAIGIIGWIIIFYAIDYKRPEKSKIKALTWDFFIVVVLMFIGSFLINDAKKIVELVMSIFK